MPALALRHVGDGQSPSTLPKGSGLQKIRTEQIRTGVASVHVLADVREQRRDAFARAIAQHGAIVATARAWDVDESVVRRVRDGRKPLTDARIAALPTTLRLAFERALAAAAWREPEQLALPLR